MMKHSQFAVAAVITLLIACVTSEPGLSEGEWKSLGNPQGRNLFFKILQSYFNGRGMNLVGMGRKGKLLGNLESRANPSFDKYQHSLQNNDIFDA